MRDDTRTQVKAFRRALALAAGERSGEPEPRSWHNYLADFPAGCCELASQTLVKYLRDHDPNLFPYVIGLQWIENGDIHGHVFVALDGDYIDLTLDQFDEYDDWIVAEPIASGGTLDAFLQKVRRLEGTITTRKVTLNVIQGHGHRLYGWLKKTADGLLAAAGQNVKPEPLPALVSGEIRPDYRDWSPAGPSAKAAHVPEKKRPKMTHEGTITECYKPRHVRLRETSTQWVSECGLRFRKGTGAAVGSGVWSANRLDLSSIREIQPGG
ncbi:hypothetical protein PWO23_23965 (plasmid) [Serratia marcescens]|uniref:hypothetical protein n=1 Tax=Serratia marcescens TaxID=615 RepID=UPI0023A924A4|nr:hypothetical protein [Serratia marcescens]WEA51994.1 hypothetical protein PWO23_23965 [Serratia marcescens]